MNIEATRRFVRGSIALLSVLGVTASQGQDDVAREPTVDSTPGPLGYVLIHNATTETIRYRSWYPDTPQKSLLHTLSPDTSHLYRVGSDFNCRHGTPGAVIDSLLRRSTMYAFRAAGEKPGGPVTLVAVSRPGEGPSTPAIPAPPHSAAIPTPSQPGEAPAPAVATERERELELTIQRLTDEVRHLSSRPAETRPPVGKAVAHRGTGLHWSGGTVRLGPLDLSAGAAEAELTLTLERDPDTVPTALNLAADFTPARGSARVRPETTEIPADGVLKLTLAFDGVPAAATRVGKVIVRARGAPPGRDLVIPVAVTFRARLSALGADGETTSILSWPPGADVYLVDESQEDAWSLEHLGTTPVACRLPAGRYQAVLVQREKAGGKWLAPGRQFLALCAGEKQTARIWLPFEKRGGAPALVRAVWVDRKGSAADQLERSTAGSPDLFKLPPFDEFHVPFAEMVAKAGTMLEDQDAKTVYRVLHRCGWLRYALAEDAAIDVELDPTAAGQHVRFTPNLLRPELPDVRALESAP